MTNIENPDMVRARALIEAHSRMSEDGCPHPAPSDVFRPFRARLDMSGGKAVGVGVLREAIPAAKRRLAEAVKEGEGTQDARFGKGVPIAQGRLIVR